MGIDQAQNERAAARAGGRRLLYWMALFTTVLGALYLLGLAGRLIVNGSVHAVSSPGLQTISAVVALLWDTALVILFAALRKQVRRGGRLFAELALVFMILVCALSSISWFVQLTIVPKVEQGARTVQAALLDMRNELSITYAMEHLAWGLFFGLAALFASAAIDGGRPGTWVRRLLMASGVLSLLHFLGVIVGSPALGDLGYVAWGLLLPAATALLAVKFKNAGAA